ncbi:MAG TPA: TonB family protein [Vicinamibacterales bacterium]
MIHFDFDERYQDENVVGSAITRRDGFMVSVGVHALIAVALVILPQLDLFELSPEELQAREEALRRQREERTFVFVQPRVDLEALRPPDRGQLSDLDRQAQAPQRAREPENPVPFALGNSPEQVESAEEERQQGPETIVEPDTTPPQPEPEEQIARALPPADLGIRRAPETSRPAPGALGEALRNLQRYVQNETFNNPQGGQDTPGASIQFDTKGVEFGPWLRRFVARVRRAWFIPMAAYTMRGHVVIQFNIHRDGTITDVAVVQPSSIDSFNVAAYNAIIGASPVDPLPDEYPSPQAFFTVTFYYNEQPPG